MGLRELEPGAVRVTERGAQCGVSELRSDNTRQIARWAPDSVAWQYPG